jgi:hypothetical protein
MYTGYKKIHGIKHQTIGMANGMCFHQTKAESCRRHDLWILEKSGMNILISELSFLMAFGDSAYHEMAGVTSGSERMTLLMRRAMSGVREPIEWMYRDIAAFWKITAMPWIFKLLDGFDRASNVMDMCFLFNNFWNCMNHNQTSQFFECPPPSFENYIAAGPRAVVVVAVPNL